MYHRQYGLIRTLAPLHVGASAGEESGNLNLIFRDAFTQTGIIPGSSIRGRFRAEMRRQDAAATEDWYGSAAGSAEISEAQVKFEYASLVWLPVFCPGQPVVWVSCPRLLQRYAAVIDPSLKPCIPERDSYSCSKGLRGLGGNKGVTLFFNLGFMNLTPVDGLERLIPATMEDDIPSDRLVVVADAAIGQIHDMSLYRQSRVKLADDMKKVDEDNGGFFNVEALPEGSVLVFPLAIKPDKSQHWKPFGAADQQELYFGGLESVGFGRCVVTLATPAGTEVN